MDLRYIDADIGGGGGGCCFSMKGGKGIESEGAPLMLSVSTDLSVWPLPSTHTQFIRDSFHRFQHSVWEVVQVGRYLRLEPPL